MAAPPQDAPPTTETALDFAFLSLDLNETSGEAEMAPDFYPKSMVSFKHECCNAEDSRDVMTNTPKASCLCQGRDAVTQQMPLGHSSSHINTG